MNALLLLLAPLAHGHAGADFTAVDLEREDAIETGFGLLLEESDGTSIDPTRSVDANVMNGQSGRRCSTWKACSRQWCIRS